MKGWKDGGRKGAGVGAFIPPRPTRAHLEMIMERGESSGDACSECSRSPGREEEEGSEGPGHPWGWAGRAAPARLQPWCWGHLRFPPLPPAGRRVQLVIA